MDLNPPRQLSDTDQQYLLKVLLQQPLGEALPVFLKLTGQKLVPLVEPSLSDKDE